MGALKAKSRYGERELLWRRYSRLKTDRSSFDAHWSDIDEHLLPRSARFFTTDRNRGDKRWNSIVDNWATIALDRFVGGMMSYGTSPARPWLRFRLVDEDLNDYHPVRIWLDQAARRVLEIFDKSNTYQALAQMYEYLGAYGTAASIVLPDQGDVIRHFPVPIGEFCLANDYRGDVVTLYREFDKTAGEMVQEFGYENCSPAVQQCWARGDLDNAFTVQHCIEPRSDRDSSKADAKNMAWRSVYFEKAGTPDTLLRESGFDHFPVLAPRLKLRPGDTYGEGLGMRALGDIRQLQHEQIHKANVLNQMTDPALQVPAAMVNRQVDRLPGGVNYYDQNTAGGGIRRAFEVQIDHTGLLEDIRDVRNRIDRAFYADLFVMLSMVSDTTQRTAAEIAVREEEKMSMLGPLSRQLNRELRAPLVNITFREMLARGDQVPPPPPELHGQELGIEYLDVFSQAQKQIGVNASDRFLGLVMNLANARPEVLDKLDGDAIVDDYADRYGINPKMVLASDDPRVQGVRDARNKAMAAKEQAAMAQQQADTAKALAGAPTTGGNALSDLVGYTGQ